MNTQIDSQKLLPLIQAFYQLTGMKIAIYSNTFDEVLTYPNTSCSFCQDLWSSWGGREKCASYTAAMCRKCAESNRTIVYTCHAGLTEVVSPLEENGTIFGYAVCGQVTTREDRDSFVTDVLHRCSGLDIAESEIREHLADIKYCSQSQIDATLQIINALASYIILQKMVYISDKPIGLQVITYIQEHLSEDLSVAALSKRFAMSRSQLYKVTEKYMPQGVAKYVKKCRIEAAVSAISKHPGKPLWQVAQETGFGNYEYFLRVLNKETGKER